MIFVWLFGGMLVSGVACWLASAAYHSGNPAASELPNAELYERVDEVLAYYDAEQADAPAVPTHITRGIQILLYTLRADRGSFSAHEDQRRLAADVNAGEAIEDPERLLAMCDLEAKRVMKKLGDAQRERDEAEQYAEECRDEVEDLRNELAEAKAAAK